jgi:hypothetical protein
MLYLVVAGKQILDEERRARKAEYNRLYRARKKEEKLKLQQQQYTTSTSNASASHDTTSKIVTAKINAVSVNEDDIITIANNDASTSDVAVPVTDITAANQVSTSTGCSARDDDENENENADLLQRYWRSTRRGGRMRDDDSRVRSEF